MGHLPLLSILLISLLFFLVGAHHAVPQETPPTATRNDVVGKVELDRIKRFEPHVVVVTPGTLVDFPNRDPIFHNVFSPYYGPPFDLGLYKPGDSKSVEFKAPGVAWIFCDIHQEMSGIILTI